MLNVPTRKHRDRLVALLGGGAKADAMISKAHEDFVAQSVVDVANSSKVEGKSDFFVLLKTASGDGAAVDSVKFVSRRRKA